MSTNTTTGASLIGQFGPTADLTGAHCVFTLAGRDYLVEITRCWYQDLTPNQIGGNVMSAIIDKVRTGSRGSLTA